MIELQHLTKRFATQGGTVVALNDINLTIRDGDVYGIIGMSGAGKSTLVRCINMLERPDEGRIVLDGVTMFDSEQRINLKPQQRWVGYLFQNYALFPNMTVRQNI